MQCAELSEKLAEDLASEGLKGKTITLKLKETNFEVRTRNITLTRHISSREDILHEALKLLRAKLPITIRLMVRYPKDLRRTLACVHLVINAAAVHGRQDNYAALSALEGRHAFAHQYSMPSISAGCSPLVRIRQCL